MYFDEWCSCKKMHKLSVLMRRQENSNWEIYYTTVLLLFSCPVVSHSLWPHGLQHSRSLYPSTISWSLPKFMSIASVMLSNLLILWYLLILLPLIFPSIRDFSSESSFRIGWPKYWSFSFSIGSSSEYSGLISLNIDWFDLLAIQGIFRSFLHSLKASGINSLAFCLLYGPVLTRVCNHWEDHQFSSVAQSCPTLCDPMDCSMPDLPVHHQLLEFTQTHVHLVGDAIQPSHPLSSPSLPTFNLSQHQGLLKWVSSSHIRWPKN